MEVTAGSVRAERSRFPGGVRMLVGGSGAAAGSGELRWQEVLLGPTVDLTDVEFGAASLVGALDSGDRSRWPRIVSLGGTDVALLTVSYARLAECRLAGVHNLDKLAIEGYRTFETAPSRWWISGRFVTRDEHLLRTTWARGGRRR